MEIEATYCPEDNKIRIYSGRVDRETYEALRDAKYKSTPKQNCDFVATWSPKAEDMALSLIPDGDDIGSEDQSPQERAADRAERFAMYRDKRRAEASGQADAYESGPSAFGYQSQAKAERAAAKHARKAENAVSQWGKAEYWQRRTSGVIASAIYKSSPAVRRSRIKKLESSVRKIESYYTPRDSQRIMQKDSDGVEHEYAWCGQSRGGWWQRVDRLDKMKAAYARSLAHLHNRLTYERAMMAAEGGTAGEADIVPGGFIHGHQVRKVNKSNATGRVVSVLIWGPHQGRKNSDGSPQMGLVKLAVERLPENAYRAPTDKEAEEFARKMSKEKKAKREDAKANPKPKLTNPTEEDAQRLQDRLNAHAKAEHEKRSNGLADFEPSEVLRMNQAKYSAASKGDGSCETSEILGDGRIFSRSFVRHEPAPVVCKVRTIWGDRFYSARRVIILTDKPQKPLPAFNWQPQPECEAVNA